LLVSVKAEIDALVEVDGRAKTGATLFEIFAAACGAKANANEIDDSSGSFGEFVRALLLSCMRAQQRAGARPFTPQHNSPSARTANSRPSRHVNN
jgi:hypothetical protein